MQTSAVAVPRKDRRRRVNSANHSNRESKMQGNRFRRSVHFCKEILHWEPPPVAYGGWVCSTSIGTNLTASRSIIDYFCPPLSFSFTLTLTLFLFHSHSHSLSLGIGFLPGTIARSPASSYYINDGDGSRAQAAREAPNQPTKPSIKTPTLSERWAKTDHYSESGQKNRLGFN